MIGGFPGEISLRGGSAIISDDQRYRYVLYRVVGKSERGVLWVMLNPSKADADQDDPTIRRCIAFTRRWGYGWMSVVNLFALRATDPNTIGHVGPETAIGAENDYWIENEAPHASLIIAAWGAKSFGRKGLFGRDAAVRRMLKQHELHHVGLTKNGQHPRHPLYVPGATTPERWT